MRCQESLVVKQDQLNHSHLRNGELRRATDKWGHNTLPAVASAKEGGDENNICPSPRAGRKWERI
jgi:hypothetical protein